MPIISVIIPIYNVGEYLSRCINSILTQSFSDFELILVDDGSKDNSGIICDEYAKHDNRVVVIHKKNGGAASARNTGLDWVFANSNSAWICFIDGDDWIHKDYIKLLYDACVENGLLISRCEFKRTNKFELSDEIITTKAVVYSSEDLWRERIMKVPSPCCMISKKDLWKSLRFPEDKRYEDNYITYKLIFMVQSIAFLDVPLYYYFNHESSFTHKINTEYYLDMYQGQRESIDWFDNNGFLFTSIQEAQFHLKTIIEHLTTAKETCSSSDIALLRDELRKSLAAYKGKLKLSPFKNDILYYYAFPIIMLPLHMFKAIIRHLRKKDTSLF